MRIRIPEGKWSSGWEVVIFPIWKITLHCFGNMSKLLNPGRSLFSQTDTLFRNFIISEKDQLPFKTKAFVYDLKACTTQMEELNMFHVAAVVVITGSPSDMCCRQGPNWRPGGDAGRDSFGTIQSIKASLSIWETMPYVQFLMLA